MAEELWKRIDDVRKRLDDLRAGMRSRFRWTVTTMVALFGFAVPVWMRGLSLILRMD